MISVGDSLISKLHFFDVFDYPRERIFLYSTKCLADGEAMSKIFYFESISQLLNFLHTFKIFYNYVIILKIHFQILVAYYYVVFTPQFQLNFANHSRYVLHPNEPTPFTSATIFFSLAEILPNLKLTTRSVPCVFCSTSFFFFLIMNT